MTKKEIGRAVAFALVVCLMLVLLCDLFELENSSNYDKRFYTYRNFNDDTIDAVWIGTSGADRYWIPSKAYEEYGMTVYPLVSDAMPTWLLVNMIEEAYTYQNPELIIIDTRAFGQTNPRARRMENRSRRVLDAMQYLSPNWFKATFKTTTTIHKAFNNKQVLDASYLLPFIKYHSKWEEDDYTLESNLGGKIHSYAGFFMNSQLSVQQAETAPVPVRYNANVYIDLDPVSEESLYELLEYITANNINVLFVDTPQYKTLLEMGRANTVYRILDEYDIDYINLCQTDKEGNFYLNADLDPATDFYDEGHVNYYGAEKFTAMFAAYLDENYDLPDRRDDESVKEYWDGIYKKTKRAIARWENDATEE